MYYSDGMKPLNLVVMTVLSLLFLGIFSIIPEDVGAQNIPVVNLEWNGLNEKVAEPTPNAQGSVSFSGTCIYVCVYRESGCDIKCICQHRMTCVCQSITDSDCTR